MGVKKSEFDLIVERAEVVSYLMAIQKCQLAGGQFLNAVEPLALNMKDEAQMADWIQTNSPGMLAPLWPKIQSTLCICIVTHIITITNTIIITK